MQWCSWEKWLMFTVSEMQERGSRRTGGQMLSIQCQKYSNMRKKKNQKFSLKFFNYYRKVTVFILKNPLQYQILICDTVNIAIAAFKLEV